MITGLNPYGLILILKLSTCLGTKNLFIILLFTQFNLQHVFQSLCNVLYQCVHTAVQLYHYQSVNIITTIAMLNYVLVKIIFIFKHRHSVKVKFIYPHSDTWMPDDSVAVLKCLVLCMYLLIENAVKYVKHTVETEILLCST